LHLQSHDLERLGWSPAFEEQFREHAGAGLAPARVAVQHRSAYVLYAAAGELAGEVSGRLLHDAEAGGDLPVTGDWVAVRVLSGEQRAVVHAVLPRTSKFSRAGASDQHRVTEEQVVAANVDVVFLVSSFGDDLNPRRLERYLTMTWESGADPVVVLTKADLCDDVATAVAEVEAVTFGIPIHVVSNVTGEGIDELRRWFEGNRTIALLGSSGVGKSTLVNRLVGEEALATQEVRSDGRGRHTTSHRELVLLPEGGLVLDTPGMRELQLWSADDGFGAAFGDVEELAAQCRFADCAHRTEPGCAVRAAIADGTLPAERLASFEKLQRELAMLARRQDKRARSEARKAYARQERSRRKTVW
jgi:ribosome biogenesis GTPase / thiamine phosphate phosphatase